MNETMITNISSLRDITKNLIKSDEYIKDAKKIEDNTERVDVLVSNQNAVLMKVIETASIYNKGKKPYLKKFIDSYISTLTITQDFELVSKLYYYLSVYELNWVWGSDKLDNEIIESPSDFSKKDIMIELLFNCVYLPEYKNQNQFNSDMLQLLPRIEKRITKFRLWQKPFIFAPVNPRALLNHLEDTSWYAIRWVKHIDKWVIKKVWYKFSISEKFDMAEENEFYISIMIDTDNENWFWSQEYIRHLVEDLWKKWIDNWKNFYYTQDSLFRYNIYIWEEFFNWSDDELDDVWFSKRMDNYWFEFRIYANSRLDINPEEVFANACYRLPELAEQIISDIYETYWRDSKWDTWYPSKPYVFDISKIINAEEMQDWFIDDIDDSNWKIKKIRQNSNGKKYRFYKPSEIEYSLQDLILEDKTIETLYDLLDYFKNINFYIKNNWILPWWMVLVWPPGTWKTTLVQVLWKESWAWVFVADSAQEDSLVWDSAKNIESIINDAEKYIDDTWKPAIIFFDEADTLFSSRWWEVKDFKEWMLSVILQKMDWFDKKYQWKLTFAFGTNRDDLLDKALLSRIDKHLLVDLPSLENRIKILDLHIRKKMKWIQVPMYELADLDLEYIAKQLDKKSGRFIKNLIWNAHNRWLRMYLQDKKFVMTNDLILSFKNITEKQEKEREFKVWFIN